MACINRKIIRDKVQELISKNSESDKTKLLINVALSVRQALNIDSYDNKFKTLSLKWLSLALSETLDIEISQNEFNKISKPNTEAVDSEIPTIPQIENKTKTINFGRTLNNWYQESIVKDLMLLDFRLNIVKNLFLNLDAETIISDIVDGNINLQLYKSTLLKDLINYYNNHNSDKIPEHTLYDSESNFFEVPKSTIEKLDNYFKKLSELQLDNLLNINPEFVKAYNLHFLYKYFDELLLDSFNDTVEISSYFIGKDVSGTNKYKLLHTDRNATNWNDKERTPDDVLNIILNYILNSFKKYRFGSSTPITGTSLTKVDLNKSISTIKQIITSPISKTILLASQSDLYRKHKDTLQRLGLYENDSLYKLGNMAREYPVDVYPILFDYFSASDIKNSITTKYDGWDSIYSLNKLLFTGENKSLFNVSLKNKNTRYYRQFIAHLDLTSPNPISTVTSESGETRMKLLFRNNIDLIRRTYELNINGTLSEPILDLGVDVKWNKENDTFVISKKDIFEAVYNPKSNIDVTIKFFTDKDSVLASLSEYYLKITGLDFSNSLFLDEIKRVYQYSDVNKDLLKLCVPMTAKHIFITNYKFENNNKLEEDLKSIFGTSAPKINFTSSKHIDFVSSGSALSILGLFVDLYAGATGLFLRSVERTTDGNMVPAQTITNGSTETTERWEALSKKDNSVAKHFSIFDLYEGLENLRDLNVNGIYKRATRMTFNENIFTRFVYHFLEPRSKNQTKVIYSVTSDKEHIGVKNFKFQFKPLQSVDEELVYEASDKSKLIQDLGTFYANIEAKVNSNYLLLNTFLTQNPELRTRLADKYGIDIKDIHIGLLGKNAFVGLNKANNPLKLFREIIHEYNKQPNLYIGITHNVDYQTQKNKLYENNLILDLKSRYQDPIKYQLFIKERNEEFYLDLIKNDFLLEVYNTKRLLLNPAYKYILRDSTGSWVDKRTGNLILAKLKIGNKLYSDFIFEKGKNLDLILHPALAEFNELLYLLSEQYNNATLGSYIFCDAKKQSSNPDLRMLESVKHTDFIKRNVDQSATVNLYQLNTLESLLSDIDVAYIEDITADVNTVSGIGDNVKPFDGSTFVEAITNYLINSTSDKPKNTTDKPLLTGYLPESGSGLIIKTAGFAFNNLNMRNSSWRLNMEKKMLSRNFGILNITKDYDGNIIDYGDIFIKSNQQYYKLNLKQSLGNNKYNVSLDNCGENGEILNKGKDFEVTINTCWDLFLLFGGINSCSLKNGKLELSEDSILKMVTAVNRVGNKNEGVKDNLLLTLLHVNQPLKRALINMLVTEGACKKGIVNLNPIDRYSDNEPLDVAHIKAILFGRQLDPTHEVDLSEVALMTLVMSALSSSHSLKLTNLIYKALSELANLNNEKYSKLLKEALSTEDLTKFKDYIANFIVKSLSKDSKSTVLKIVLDPVIEKFEQGEQITFNDITKHISLDEALPYLSSLIASSLNSESIKSDFSGTLSVLNPSYGIEKRYTGFVNGQLVTNRKLSDLSASELLVPDIKNPEFILFEHTYNIPKNIGTKEYPIYDFEELETITVHSLEDYNKVKSILKNLYPISEIFYKELPLDSTIETNYGIFVDGFGNKIYKQVNSIADISDNLNQIGKIQLFGHDLSAYNILFKDINGKQYQIWDLQVVLDAYINRSDRLSRENMLNVLKNLSEGNLDQILTTDGVINIDKSSINIKNYLAILPSVHKKQFGIKNSDSVQLILDDPNFFYKRGLENIISGLDASDYQVALRNLNGEHYYLTTKNLANDPKYSKIEFNIENDNGTLYRLNNFNERVHEISSLDDLIYEFNGQEIICTKNFDFYLNEFEYNLADKGSLEGSSDSILDGGPYAAAEYVNLLLENYSELLISRKGFEYVKDKINNFLSGNQDKISFKDLPEAKDLDYKLLKYSKQIHTSFKKSLEMLVARIPAQGMSSFMTMDIIDFTGNDTNNTYVNHMLIFLQGSDFDVDKATFMAYEIDKSGKFVGWSPYFKLNDESTLNSSLKLPFPSKSNIIKLNSTLKGDFLKTEALLSFLDTFDIKDTENLNSDKIEQISELLNLDFGGNYDFNSEYFQKNYLKYVDVNGNLLNKYNKLINIINKHNNYFQKISGRRKEMAFKNFITNGSCQISKDPINIIRSQEPIDVASEELKSVADNSNIARQISYINRLPGNEGGKASDLITVMTGKDGITVAASIGIKTYNALLNFVNNCIEREEWSKIVKPIVIAGLDYGVLASVDVDLNKVPEQYRKYFEKSQLVFDVRNTISAWVSLAVDNAKELRLGLLNADMNFMGMYIYGAFMGVPMETVSNILTSTTAQVLSKVMLSNVYKGKVEIKNPESAHKWIYEIPKFKTYSSESRNSFDVLRRDIIRINKPINDQIALLRVRLELAKKEQNQELFEVISKQIRELSNKKIGFDSYKLVENTAEYIKNSQLHYLFIKDFQLFYREYKYKRKLQSMLEIDSEVIDGKRVNKNLQDIITLSKGQLEIASLRNLLGLNQGIKSDLTKALMFIDRLQSDYKIDFNKYIYDELYRKSSILEYEKKKVSWNPLDVIESIPHYRSYLESLNIYYNAMRIAPTYKILSDSGYRDLKDNFKQVDESLVKAMLYSFLRDRANDWLKSQNIEINIDKQESRILTSGEIVTFKKNYNLLLGDDASNALFIEYMNNKVIPDLKRGFLGHRIDRSVRDNKFVHYLLSTFVNRTPNRTGQSINRLGVETLPRTDYEEFELRRVVLDFYDLSAKNYTINGLRYNLGDLFWYYNLIISNTLTNRNSLTPIFRKLISNNPIIKNYYSFGGKISEIFYSNQNKRLFLIPAAPITSVNIAKLKNLKLFILLDRDLHKTNIMERSVLLNDDGVSEVNYIQINLPGTLRDSFGFTLKYDARLELFYPNIKIKNGKTIATNVEYEGLKLGDVEIPSTDIITKDGQKSIVIEYQDYIIALLKKYREINPC